MDQSQELLDVVDDCDRVTGQAARGEIHKKSLLHRAAHILVFNSKGELFLQKRALTKDENPGLWDSSAAGHVNAGEDYQGCAHRELKEELGIAAPLTLHTRLSASAATCWEHIHIYICVTDQHITADPVEISEGRFWPMPEIRATAAREDGRFTATLRVILRLLEQNPPGGIRLT